MYAEERRQQIIQHAREHGRVQVSWAAEAFDVTPETIRRDLEALDRSGLLRRVHGGAMPSELLGPVDLALAERDAVAAAEKERIARAALALWPAGEGATVVLDAGSTTARLAALVPAEATTTVFTSSLPVASLLSSRTGCAVEILGGRVKGLTQACVGPAALTALSRLRVDVCFLGTNGVSASHGLSTPDVEEAALKRAMAASARRTVVLADHTKLGAESTSSFAGLDDVDVLVTDAISPTHRAVCSERGIEVVVA